MAVEARPNAGVEATVAEIGQTAMTATFEPIGPVIMKDIPDPIWFRWGGRIHRKLT